MVLADSDVARFMAKVNRDGPVPSHMPTLGPCWVWTASTYPDTGYGQFRYQGRPWQAHRIAFLFDRGGLTPGLFVLHHCDNRLCVRPDHLFEGTARHNVDDMMTKGRYRLGLHPKGRTVPYEQRRRGQDITTCVLNEGDVIEMRRLWATGKWTVKQLAARFGCGSHAAHAAVTGETWSHIRVLRQPSASAKRWHRESALPTGENHHNARLTVPKVVEIRSRAAAGETATALAREFGVSDTAVLRIIARRAWRHC